MLDLWDDVERLKVKVTNGAVTAIGMWGYTPVGLTGILVKDVDDNVIVFFIFNLWQGMFRINTTF